MSLPTTAKFPSIKFEISTTVFRFVTSWILALCTAMSDRGEQISDLKLDESIRGNATTLRSALSDYADGGRRNFSDSELLRLMICVSRRNMKKSKVYCYSLPNPNDGQAVSFQVKCSKRGFTVEDYQFLISHFPARSTSESVLSLFAYIVETALRLEIHRLQCKTNISSPGSKQSISSSLQLPDGIGSSFEGFARTFSSSLNYRKLKPHIKLVYNDIDWRFCNYMRMLVKYPLHLIAKIKSIGATIILYSVYYSRCKSINADCKISDDVKQCIKDNYSEFKKMANVPQSAINTLDEQIEAAAALFWLVNLSYQGNEKAGCGTTNIKKNFPKMINELLLASMRLQGITILQMDIKAFIKKFKNRSDVLVILDPPYLGANGTDCEDYINDATDVEPFTLENMTEMFRLCAKAKFKVLFFHSYNEKIFKLCEKYGFRYQFSYSGQKKRGVYSDIDDLSDNHNTIVCTLRIDTPIYNSKSDRVKFCEALNNRLNGISSAKKGGEA